MESSSVRHSSWLSGSDEKDISFGVDAVGNDEREDQDAEAHHQGDKLREGRREGLRTHCSFGKLESGIRTAEFWCWLQAAQ
jgi:hypothetical protein